MKKFFSILMVMTLTLSMIITSFAAPGTNGSITITNADIDETYKFYKIFEATFAGDAITYTINPTDEFFDDLFGASGTAVNDYFEYHATTGVITRKAGKTDAELFTYLGTLVKTATPTIQKTATDTTLTVDGLTHGYYVIDRTHGLANGITITDVAPSVSVHDKNDLPGQLEKIADKESVSVGDVISYTVSFVATHYDNGEKVLLYTIEDNLTSPPDWAVIDLSSIAIEVDGVAITKDTDWTMVSGTASGFKIDIPWVYNDADKTFKYGATVKVEITYSVTVTEAAVAPDNTSKTNTVKLTWNNKTDKEKTDVETIEVFNMGFTKIDGTDSTKTLPGAVFALYSDSACTVPVYVKPSGAAGVYIVDKDPTYPNIVVTPASGQVVVMGLAEGTYYLKETQAPAGYNPLTSVIEVAVNKTDNDSMEINSVNYSLNNAEKNIVNNTGVELPSTGGEGTFWLITIGTLMAISFAVFLITHKKMSVYTD